jgi:hypothetical protein
MRVRASFIANNKILKRLEQAQKRALLLTVEALKTDVETSQVVPKQIGELERSGFVDDSELERFVVSLIYDTPYARRLYWHPEYNFRKDKNPNAMGKWLEPYISGEKKDFVKKTFAFFLKQEAKGLIK